MTAGSAKNPNNVTSTFFNTVHLLPQGLRFERGVAKFCSCPGRHLTSLCPCLLYVHFKIFERLIYTRVEPIIAPTTRLEQAGFRHGRSTVDQVTLLTQDTEGSCSAKKKAVAVFVDTTAAYETAWHRGLACKQLRLLPERNMVGMIMELVGNRSFTLITNNIKRSRLRRLKNCVQQGSVLAPFLLSIYTSDLPTTISRNYAYADTLAIMHADGDWQAVERVLSKDMATIGGYLHNWTFKLSTTKTVAAVFRLNNKEAKRELKVNFNSETLRFCSEPKCLGITLDRMLTYRRHLESLRKKLTSRVALLRRLLGSGWGAEATALRTTTLALVHSTAENCAPAWRRSAHTRLIDLVINDALRTVTGCLCPNQRTIFLSSQAPKLLSFVAKEPYCV